MSKPMVCVVSRIAGLRSAVEARGLAGSWLHWLEGPANDDALATCEVLVGEPAVCAAMVDRCPRLLWVQSTFAGCNELLTGSVRRDYVATRLGGCFGPDMAEYAAMHILVHERQYEVQRSSQRSSQWLAARSPSTGVRQGGADYRRLSTLTLGVLGLGQIGSDIARTASQGLRMKVIGLRTDPSPRPSDRESGVAKVFGFAELPTFLAECDYIVSVLPSTPATRGMLDGGVLHACSARRPVLVNVGRGDLLSESSVIEALDGDWLRHYVGDVFVPEPLPPQSPLWLHPKATVTPHNAAVTMPEDVATAFESNLHRFEAGGVANLENVFNWDAGY